MSYARFGWEGSDVYLIGTTEYGTGAHVIECCGCIFQALGEGAPFPHFATNEAALAHLDQHCAAGHTVPESAYEAIREDDWVMGHG